MDNSQCICADIGHLHHKGERCTNPRAGDDGLCMQCRMLLENEGKVEEGEVIE